MCSFITIEVRTELCTQPCETYISLLMSGVIVLLWEGSPGRQYRVGDGSMELRHIHTYKGYDAPSNV